MTKDEFLENLKSPHGVAYGQAPKIKAAHDAEKEVMSEWLSELPRRKRKKAVSTLRTKPTDQKFIMPRRARRASGKVALETVTHDKTCALYRGEKVCDCVPAITVR